MLMNIVENSGGQQYAELFPCCAGSDQVAHFGGRYRAGNQINSEDVTAGCG